MDSYPENKYVSRDDIIANMDAEHATEANILHAMRLQRADAMGSRASGLRAPVLKRPAVAIDLTSDDDKTEAGDENDFVEPDRSEVDDVVSNVLDDGKCKRRLMCGTISLRGFAADIGMRKALKRWIKFMEDETDVFVYQCEQGKQGGAQGYQHLQWCARFKKQMLYSTVRLNMQPLKGWTRGIVGADGLARMVNYCSKADTRIEGPSGTKGKEAVLTEGKGKSGTRTDILKFRKWRMENPTARIHEVPEEYMQCVAKYPRLFDQLGTYKVPKVPYKRAYVLYGKSGVGKTARAKLMAEELKMDYYVKDSSNLWFDGYHGQKCVIVDEVRAGQAGQDSKKILNMFLQMLDPEDCYLAQIKGSFSYVTAQIFIFTSPVHPSQWFHHTDFEDDPAAQLLRRFTMVKELTNQFAHPKAQDPEPLEATKVDELAEALFKEDA